MRILWVKAGKLLPVDTGGKIRSYNILRALRAEHTVTLLSYYGGKVDPQYEAAIRQELPGAETIYTAAPDSTALEQGIDYLRRLPRLAPYAVSKFTHTKVKQVLRRYATENRFDVAVCDFLSASLNFPGEFAVPVVLFQHNVESSLWQRMAATERHPLKKLSFQIESAKMTRYERITIKKFHHVIAVSEHDRQQMLHMDPGCEITVVPTGVDTKKFAVAPPSQVRPPRIVFTGSMDWEPNIDAMEYFCEQIWPRVRSAYPDGILQIVGRNPHAKVQRLASDSVQITGTVPSVADYLRDASLVIVPLRIGGGTRLKIFEAMAMGKAVISTSIGAEGLDVESGRDLLLADDAGTFADAILLLLRDADLRRKYEQAAVQLASQYDWSRIAVQFADVLRRATGRTTVAQEGSRPALTLPS